MPADLLTFSSTFWNLRSFSVGSCEALSADRFICCSRRSHSIKLYLKGKAQVEKRLDIVKLIKMSLDVELLKKHFFLPSQQKLFKKQRRHALKVESSSSSARSADSDPECQIFM